MEFVCRVGIGHQMQVGELQDFSGHVMSVEALYAID